jgi:hypothetical protein
MYLLDVLGPSSDIQLERLNIGGVIRYRLLFTFRNLDTPMKYTIKYTTLEMIVVWLDRESLRKACREMFASPPVRECETPEILAAYRSAIRILFDVIKTDPIFRDAKLRLRTSDLADGFGMDKFVVDKRNEAGYDATMTLSMAQLVLWYHMDKMKTLADLC